MKSSPRHHGDFFLLFPVSVAEINRKLDLILRNQQILLKIQQREEAVTLDDLVPQPVDTKEQLGRLNEKLEDDPELRKKLVYILMLYPIVKAFVSIRTNVIKFQLVCGFVSL